MRSTKTCARISRFGLSAAGWRNASAELQRMPLRCVSWKRETPSGSSTFRSSMCAYPASTAASSSASMNGDMERLSDTERGPPTPWNSSGPRSLSSDRLKYGQHLVVRPARAALLGPAVEVGAVTAEVDHRVDRARASDDPAAREVQTPPTEARLFLAEEVPVEVGLEHEREHRRDVQLRCGVRPSRLQQEDRDVRVLAQAAGEHAARGPGSDDHVVSHGRALLRSRLRPGA